MPAIYHEGSWLGNATDPEVLVKDTVGWTGKNLLKNTGKNTTSAGITTTINADKSITLNGTATSGDNQCFLYGTGWGQKNYVPINETPFEVGETYIMSKGSSDETARLIFYFYNGDIYITDVKCIQKDATFTIPQNTTHFVCVARVNNGATVSNLTFYPMIRKADITDPTYEPYHESVEEEIEQIYADNGVLGAKNLLPNNATSQTVNGVTFTVNDDGSITVNGTATADAKIFISKPNENIVFDSPVIFSGSPSQSASDTVYMRVDRYNGDTYVDGISCYGGNEVLLSDITKKYRDFRITVLNGKTVSNLTFHPMLRLVSDPDDTYQPYAMTNRELTEKVFEKRTLTSADDLNNVTETGIYGITTQPSNSPSSYATLIVNRRSDGDISQLIQKSDSMYTRAYGGNPAVWTSWYKFAGTVVS